MSVKLLKDLAKLDRPREKLQRRGATALTDLELFMALIGSGNAQSSVDIIARKALDSFQKNGVNIAYADLKKINGLGQARICEILAALELSRRYLIKPEQPIIDSAAKAVAELGEIKDKKQEYLICLTLDGANRLISKRVITIGTLTSSLVHPREVFADAITDRAAAIIVAHNHPSGNLSPSAADLEITHRLREAGEILGIPLHDHLIVTREGYRSVFEKNN